MLKLKLLEKCCKETLDIMRIIINADDFGLNELSSRAIIDAFNKGYISSTTICANGDYFEGALELAKANNLNKNIGIHINLTEGEPLTNRIKEDSFFCTDKKFHGKINRLKSLNQMQRLEVCEEVKAQIEKVRKSGLSITHADSHHHIHTGIFFAPTILKVLKQYNIKKVRLHRNMGNIKILKLVVKKLCNLLIKINDFTTVNYFGDINDFKNRNSYKDEKTIEIMVHPVYNENHSLIDINEYAGKPNGEELGEVLKLLKGKKLFSYYDV